MVEEKVTSNKENRRQMVYLSELRCVVEERYRVFVVDNGIGICYMLGLNCVTASEDVYSGILLQNGRKLLVLKLVRLLDRNWCGMLVKKVVLESCGHGGNVGFMKWLK